MLADQRHHLNDEFDALVKKIQQKYLDRKKPLILTQKDIISGKITDFPNDLIQKFDQSFEKLHKKHGFVLSSDDKPTDVNYLKGKSGIPDFWPKAM